MNDYEWDETDAPQFNKDNYSTVNVNYTVFDGKKPVFDINQI